jgi:gliding motility-associated-like protein
MIKIIKLVIILFFTGYLFCQKEANNWYFGYNAGISFNNGKAEVLLDSQMSTDEGCSSISDADGNLLFYTDGITVYNKKHEIMQNGTGLMGSPSSSQSGLIIQKPGSKTNYYIFTVSDAELNYLVGVRYSEVDMTGDNGNGVITTNKNILLQSPSTEKITGIRHKNNSDVWVVTHDNFSNDFRSFLVTKNGISNSSVISSIGYKPVHDSSAVDEAGYLKANIQGTKIATAWFTDGVYELFDFDNASGSLSNVIRLSEYKYGAYGVEFSPDGSKLYCSNVVYPSGIPGPPIVNIFQYNLCAGTTQDIINSFTVIMSGATADYGIGAMQIAPDGKIYCARFNFNPLNPPLGNSKYLGVIHNPNELGIACNYVDLGFDLGTSYSGFGLPNFVPYNLKQTISFLYTINCLNANFTAPVEANCSQQNNILNYQWNFGDSNSISNTSSLPNPTHTFTQKGKYLVQLILEYANKKDTLTDSINISIPTAYVGKDTTIFIGGTVNLTAQGGVGYIWNNGENTQNITINPTNTTTYCVTVKDKNDCLDSNCITVTVVDPSIPDTTCLSSKFSYSPDTTIMVGNSVILFANGGGTYLWHTNDTLSHISVSPTISTDYCVQVTSPKGCIDSSCIHVQVNIPVDIPDGFSPNGDGINDVWNIKNIGTYIAPKVSIYNRWGQAVIEDYDYKIPWDGTQNGIELPMATYYYVIYLNNGKIKHQGTITLKR